MKKLQNKTFILLISIFTVFLLCMLTIFNVSIYSKEYKDIKDKLIRIENAQERFNHEKDVLKNPLFMDMEAYVLIFDTKGEIKSIINYTDDGLSNEDIVKLVNDNKKKIRIDNISNLYFNNYIFYLNKNGNLIIINNSMIKNYLISSLITSLILFILLEVFIVYISIILTRWLVKPVEESFMKQKQFIYDASHELKTPLSIIMASTEMLEENPKEKKWLFNIKSETERMNKLVIDLLELAKTEDIKENEIYEEINLSKIIENKAISFESIMFEQGLTLRMDIEDDIMIKGNADRLKELLSILIDNAIKHGYEKSKIKISLYKDKDMINLEVKNRGDAIPLEDRDKIFERFYRGDKSRNRDSNRYGLGLAIAKNIVDNHRGVISVICQNGYTTFKVTFKQS